MYEGSIESDKWGEANGEGFMKIEVDASEIWCEQRCDVAQTVGDPTSNHKTTSTARNWAHEDAIESDGCVDANGEEFTKI